MTWPHLIGVSFDVGGTLVREEGGPVTGEIADLLGTDLPSMRTHLGRSAKRRRQAPGELAVELAAEFDRPNLTRALTRLLERRRDQCLRPSLMDGAVDVLTTLAARGYRITLLSNVVGAIAPWADDLPVFWLADAVLMSCDTGWVKPERAAFDEARRVLRAEPDQLAHVGDSYGADVQGALAAGWHAVHVTANCAPEPRDRCLSVAGLPALLDIFVPATPVRRGAD